MTPSPTEISTRATREARRKVERCQGVREDTSVVQNRFGFAEKSVNHVAETVENRAGCAMAPADMNKPIGMKVPRKTLKAITLE